MAEVVGGEGESLSQWVEECKSMRLLRVAACKSSKRANTGDSLYNLNALNDKFIPTCVDNWESKTTKDWKEMNWKNWMMMFSKACKLLFLRVHASPEFRHPSLQVPHASI